MEKFIKIREEGKSENYSVAKQVTANSFRKKENLTLEVNNNKSVSLFNRSFGSVNARYKAAASPSLKKQEIRKGFKLVSPNKHHQFR